MSEILIGTGLLHITVDDDQHGPRDLLNLASVLISASIGIAAVAGVAAEADGESWGDDGTQPRKTGGAGLASLHGVAVADGLQALLSLADRCVLEARHRIEPLPHEKAARANARARGDA